MSDDTSVTNPGYRSNRPGRNGRMRGSMDPATRRLIMFASGLAVVLICLIGASTLLRHRSSSNNTVPVVAADVRPVRVKPDNPGGMQIDSAETDVFSGGVDDRNAKLAPGAETPDPNGMHGAAAMLQPKPAVAPEASGVSTTPPVVTALAGAEPSAAMADDTPSNATLQLLLKQPSAAALSTTPASPAPASMASPGPVVAAAKPAITALADQPPALVHPAPAPAALSAPSAYAPATATTAVAKPAASIAARSGHPAMVQLAALTTEQAAHQEWQQLNRRMPGLLSGRQPSFSHIERDGRTFWRLRMSGFSDMAQARTFCEHVRAKGGGCSVADF